MALSAPTPPSPPGPLPPLPLPPIPTPPSPGALNVFPVSSMISWPVTKTPNWATRIQRSVSGKELRSSDYVLPLWNFIIRWEVLRDRWDVRMGTGRLQDELRAVWDFFNNQVGADLPFAYYDVSDNTTRFNPVTPNTITFAIGDGVNSSFQMASALLAPVVPLAIVSATPAGPYVLNTYTGEITFSSPPGLGVSIGADFSYYYRLRFDDSLSAENFAYQFWEMKQLTMVSALD